MKKKRPVLIRVSYLIELPEDEIGFDNDMLDKITDKIGKSKMLIIDNKKTSINWSQTSSLMLDSNSLNCGKCTKCGQWTTDEDKPKAIDGLCRGATVDGNLLCDECLPHDHKWAF